MQLDRPILAITPTADADVLAALARADAWFSVSQLQRVIDRYSNTGIRKVLNRLAEQGIVTAVDTANSVSYRLNREHLVADAVLTIVDVKAQLFARLQNAMAGWPDGVRYAAVFGSAVGGEMRVRSDVDLLVVHDDDTDDALWDGLSVDLQLAVHQWTGNPLSLISMPTSEVRDRRGDNLMREISRLSVTVRGDREWFDRVLKGGGSRAHA